jgi:hypothetical protein
MHESLMTDVQQGAERGGCIPTASVDVTGATNVNRSRIARQAEDLNPSDEIHYVTSVTRRLSW